MTAPAAAAGVNTSTARHHNETIYHPARIPGVPPPSTTNPTKRTHHSKIPLNIYDMPFDKFVDHLRTIYGDDDVDLMLSGLKLIDASGCPLPCPGLTNNPIHLRPPPPQNQTTVPISLTTSMRKISTPAARTRTSRNPARQQYERRPRCAHMEPWTTPKTISPTSTGWCNTACLAPSGATWPSCPPPTPFARTSPRPGAP